METCYKKSLTFPIPKKFHRKCGTYVHDLLYEYISSLPPPYRNTLPFIQLPHNVISHTCCYLIT